MPMGSPNRKVLLRLLGVGVYLALVAALYWRRLTDFGAVRLSWGCNSSLRRSRGDFAHAVSAQERVYAMGLPDVGGALLLSALLLVVGHYVRSGALSPASLQRRHFGTLRNSARWEFAKALICAGAGLDMIRLIVNTRLEQQHR
jgi:hypothetical protein